MSVGEMFVYGLVVSLAAFRITYLFVYDTITERLRQRVWARFPMAGQPVQEDNGTYGPHDGTFIGDLLTCHWCTGWWVSLVAAIVFLLAPEVAVVLSVPWAFSAIVGLLGDL